MTVAVDIVPALMLTILFAASSSRPLVDKSRGSEWTGGVEYTSDELINVSLIVLVVIVMLGSGCLHEYSGQLR